MKTLLKLPWLRITAWAVLIHVILIALSFLEVFIFSLMNPGQDQDFYREHAQWSGPYVSIIFGFVLFFLIARSLTRKYPHHRLFIILALPVVYTIMDFALVQGYGVDWEQHYFIFLLSFIIKALGGILGAMWDSWTRKSTKNN